MRASRACVRFVRAYLDLLPFLRSPLRLLVRERRPRLRERERDRDRELELERDNLRCR